ncbi:uncharacterized protein LOC116657307 [Camelus ferus]|uniref:Uncharacterized protein LOC116657307 n=1 Tax=Camelus ferus TaxID=419612 RepID=A0A8B8RDK0_CAMFR|nr:uncharacterized protein LOC116657307 [Camelus ferus]
MMSQGQPSAEEVSIPGLLESACFFLSCVSACLVPTRLPVAATGCPLKTASAHIPHSHHSFLRTAAGHRAHPRGSVEPPRVGSERRRVSWALQEPPSPQHLSPRWDRSGWPQLNSLRVSPGGWSRRFSGTSSVERRAQPGLEPGSWLGAGRWILLLRFGVPGTSQGCSRGDREKPGPRLCGWERPEQILPSTSCSTNRTASGTPAWPGPARASEGSLRTACRITAQLPGSAPYPPGKKERKRTMYSMEAFCQFLNCGKILICCLKESLKTTPVRQSAGTTRRAAGRAENTKAACPAPDSQPGAVIIGKCSAKSGWAEVGGLGGAGGPDAGRAASHPF